MGQRQIEKADYTVTGLHSFICCQLFIVQKHQRGAVRQQSQVRDIYVRSVKVCFLLESIITV